jgi:transcriptional regulator with XRE-family HTH domain
MTTTAEQQFHETLGARIQAARKRARVTQDQLAKAIGLTRASVANMEAGRQSVPVQALPVIADVLHADLGTLLRESAQEPWPISNAIACLKEVRDREKGDDERGETVRLSMEYAIATVRGINQIRAPQPPDPAAEADRAVRRFCRDLGDAFENLGRAFADIADGDIPDRGE